MPPIPSDSVSNPAMLVVCRRLAAAASILAAALGALALLGWVLGLDYLKSIVPGQASVNPLSALGLLLLGAALWLLRHPPILGQQPILGQPPAGGQAAQRRLGQAVAGLAT